MTVGDGPDDVYSRNITHNLTKMAAAAGIYQHLWRPEEIGITKASQLVKPLLAGLKRLRADPDAFRVYNPSNGWGSYEGLVEFFSDYMGGLSLQPRGHCPRLSLTLSRMKKPASANRAG